MMVGLHCQRAALILFIIMVPITMVWFCAEPLLVLAGQSPEVSALAGRFVLWYLPGIYFIFLLEIVKRFLAVQGRTGMVLVVCGVATFLTPAIAWALIYNMRLGFAGCPIAMAVGRWVNIPRGVWGKLSVRDDKRGRKCGTGRRGLFRSIVSKNQPSCIPVAEFESPTHPT